VLIGSHLDTVPEGGRFDGALGVVGGLHALSLLREWGVEPRRPIWLAAFMDEENTRFNTALYGPYGGLTCAGKQSSSVDKTSRHL
jgi:acetylornithine deacetylase/succinyl-diaminopimelate desuccinylase-like protein